MVDETNKADGQVVHEVSHGAMSEEPPQSGGALIFLKACLGRTAELLVPRLVHLNSEGMFRPEVHTGGSVRVVSHRPQQVNRSAAASSMQARMWWLRGVRRWRPGRRSSHFLAFPF